MQLHRHIYAHIKQHHKKYLLGILGSFAIVKTMFLFAGIFGLMNVANTFAIEPDDSIISQYFGPSSSYISGWTENACVVANMHVAYLSPGTNTIPRTLTGNMIYLLNSGTYITTKTINLAAPCSVIAGTGTVRLFSSVTLTSILSNIGKANTIIDNIIIDGENDGSIGTHVTNTNGIYLADASSNTISTSETKNNTYGIGLSGADYNIMRNSIVHNNLSDGIYLTNAKNNSMTSLQTYSNANHGININNSSNRTTINNVQTYNNTKAGIYLDTTNNTVINNTQSYKNTTHGIELLDSNYNTINNSQIHNNAQNGIYLENATNTYLNTTQSYTNTIGAYVWGTNNRYFGTLKLFNNTSSDIFLKTQTETLDAGIGNKTLSGGILETGGTMSCDWFTNPRDSQGYFLINTGTSPDCSTMGAYATWEGLDVSYLYGANILQQIQPLTDTAVLGAPNYSWSILPFNATKYIAEYNPIGQVAAEPDPLATYYYGTGSSFTSGRTSNACTPGAMTVEYVTPGMDTIPENLSTNTIYFLSGGDYITSRAINFANCSALVGSGKFTLYSSNTLATMLFDQLHNNIIIHNITVDGLGDGLGNDRASSDDYGILFTGTKNSTIDTIDISKFGAGIVVYSNEHTIFNHILSHNNSFGIGMLTSSSNSLDNSTLEKNTTAGVYWGSSSHNSISNTQLINNTTYGILLSDESATTINAVKSHGNRYGIAILSGASNIITNSKFYSNQDYGIGISNSLSTYIDHIQSYKNDYGIYLENSANSTINNTLSYDNTTLGMYLKTATNNVINNSQIFNNDNGIYLETSSYNALNTSISYNNNNGIYIDATSSSNILNNFNSYSNAYFGISNNGDNNQYYGTLSLFANGTADMDGLPLTTAASLFFTEGTIVTDGTMSCNQVTNPRNTDRIFMIDTATYPNCAMIGNRIGKRNLGSMSYLYGTNIPKQTKVIEDLGIPGSDSSFAVSSFSFDPTKYIADFTTTLEGTLSLFPDLTGTTNSGIQLILRTNQSANYYLEGDFEGSPMTGIVKNTKIDILFTGGYGLKSFSVTYTTGTESMETRTSITYIAPTAPTGLAYYYYGTGSPFTSGRTNNTCDPSIMTVEYIAAGTDTIPESLNTNTIYVLTGSEYITAKTINFSSCSALVGSGKVILSSNALLPSLLLDAGHENIIIDNIGIDGLNNRSGGPHSEQNDYGIFLSGTTNSTINNSQTYRNGMGIVLFGATHIVIDHIQSYNNNVGIALAAISKMNTINNTLMYNNQTYGIYVGADSINNVTNNSQIFNNDNGIYLETASHNTFTNSLTYNNNNGIYIDATSNSNIFNNIKSYSNAYFGISNNGDNNQYFGTLTLFANGTADTDGLPLTTSAAEFFTEGTIVTDGTMSCDEITNPSDIDGTYLINTAMYDTCGFMGRDAGRYSSDAHYLYGTNIIQQTQVIQDLGTPGGNPNYFASSLAFDPTHYIADFATVLSGSLSFLPNTTVTTEANNQIALTANEAADYVLTGDFEGSPLTGSLVTGATIDITLTAAYGIKNFTVTYTAGTQTQSISASLGYIQAMSKYCQTLVTDIPLQECNALFALYTSTHGDGRGNKSNWFGNGDTTLLTACDWFGLTCNARSIQQISLSKNNLVGYIPQQISDITKLAKFRAYSNGIIGIEAGAFDGLDLLDTLYFESNQIDAIVGNTFNNLPSLITLNLSANRISSIDADNFINLPLFERLTLNDNLLTGINTNVFYNLSSLQYLFLQNNQISNLDTGSLSNLTGLIYLSLNNNELDFSLDVFCPLTNLVGLDLQYNHFAGDIPTCLTGLGVLYGGNISYNYLYTNVENPELLNFLENKFGAFGLDGWRNQHFVSDLSLTGSVNLISTNSFVLSLGYQNNGPRSSDTTTIYYTMVPGVNIEIDTGYTTGNVGGIDKYIFNVGTMASGDTGTITITGTFTEILRNQGFMNTLQILSQNPLRSDNHIRNNTFGFTYGDGNITVDDRTSLFEDLPEDYLILTTGTNIDEVGALTGISIRSENIEALLPTGIIVTPSGEACDSSVLAAPEDATTAIQAEDSSIIKAFRIGSVCTGTTLSFSNPVRIRIYVPEGLGDINVVKTSSDTITRTDVVSSKINDNLIEIEAAHFSYFKIITSTSTPPPAGRPGDGGGSAGGGGAGGGGGGGLIQDSCPVQRDCSDSYYDALCGKCSLIETITSDPTSTPHGSASMSGSVLGSLLSEELKSTYLRAYQYAITTMPTIQQANMEGQLLRIDMAKMVSNFAIKILKVDLSTGTKCDFIDTKSFPKEMQYYAIAACRLGIMGYESNGTTVKKTFDPAGIVTRAQFGTALSRLIRGDRNNGGTVYYQKHLDALKAQGIMTKIDTPDQKEIRGRVMLMLKRIFEKK